MNQRIILAALVSLMLSACGGGGGSESSTPSTPAAFTINGTAAQGRAMANANISIACTVGSGATVARSDGSFSAELPEGSQLPCLVRATSADGITILHSAAIGAGSGTYTANVSPLSELVLARASGSEPSALFAEFASRHGEITSSSLADGLAYTRDALTGTVDLAGINPITDPLVAAHDGVSGNALDATIDAFITKLASARTALPSITGAIAANPNAPAAVATLLQPAAQSCLSLRTGSYRAINPSEMEASKRARLVHLDAQTLVLTESDDSTMQLGETTQGACALFARSTDASGDYVHRFYVSPSGVMIRYTTRDNNNFAPLSMTILIPEQKLGITELAGRFNWMWFGKTMPAATSNSMNLGTYTIESNGIISESMDCIDVAGCQTSLTAPGTIAVNTEGGFDYVNPNGESARWFAFKGANGNLAIIGAGTGHTDYSSLRVLTRMTALALPAVAESSRIWDMQLSGTGELSMLYSSTFTVASVDTSTSTVVRQRDDGRFDTSTFNSPRLGLRYRALNACTTAGAPTNCTKAIQANWVGLGITTYGSWEASAAPSLGISVTRP